MIPGFEKTVVGMTPGESRTVTVPAEEAYGPYRKEMVLEVPRSQFPPEMQLEIGMQLQLGSEEENKMVVAITAVTEEQITLDANHPRNNFV